MAELGGSQKEWRLQIDGLSKEFVSNRKMVKDLPDGRRRYIGLNTKNGFRIEQKTHFAKGELSGRDLTFEIADIDNEATDLFAKLPTKTTWLVKNFKHAETTASVSNTTGWNDGDIAYINSETLKCTGTGSSTTNGITVQELYFSSSARGLWNTRAESHYSILLDDSPGQRTTPIDDHPVTLEGRRARLYQYIKGQDTLSDDGSQIWQGILRSDAKFDGKKWTFVANSMDKLFKQELGNDIYGIEFKPRGIHYHVANALAIKIKLRDSLDFQLGSIVSSSLIGVGFDSTARVVNGDNATVKIPGFFEDQDEFVEEVNNAITGAISGWANNPKIYLESYGDFGWNVRFEPDSSDPLYCNFEAVSIVDGKVGSIDSPQWTNTASGSSQELDEQTDSVFAGITYKNTEFDTAKGIWNLQNNLRTVPRGFIGYDNIPGVFDSEEFETLVNLSRTENRIFINGYKPLISEHINTVNLEVSALDTKNTSLKEGSYPVTILDSSKTERWIEYTQTTQQFIEKKSELIEELVEEEGINQFNVATIGNLRPRPYTKGNAPTIKFGRTFTQAENYVELIEEITKDSAKAVNLGTAPDLRESDFDINEMKRNLREASRFSPIINKRKYTFGEPIKLKKVLTPEFQIAGTAPTINSDGKISTIVLKGLSEVDPTIATELDGNDVITETQFPTWEKHGQGMINTIKIKTGYDYKDDKYENKTFMFRDETSVNRNPKAEGIVIEPKSQQKNIDEFQKEFTDREVSEKYFELIQPLFGMFGVAPYSIIQADIAVTGSLPYNIGSHIKLTVPQLPDLENGTIGMSEKRCLVSGFSWDPTKNRASTIFYSPGSFLHGYCPTFGIIDKSNTSGDTWDLVLAFGDPLQIDNEWQDIDNVLSDYLSVDQQIQVYKWNDSALGTVQGQITSIDDVSRVVTVNFDSTWTPGSDLWVITFDDLDEVVSSQANYAYWSGVQASSLDDSNKLARQTTLDGLRSGSNLLDLINF